MGNTRKVLKVAVPPGIGDSLWSMVKIQSIMKQGNYDLCTVAIKDTILNRGREFLLHFDFINEVTYEDFPIFPIGSEFTGFAARGYTMLGGGQARRSKKMQPDFVAETGEYIYIDSCEDFLDKYNWLLIANGHLERGHRIETWLPQFDTNLDIGINNFQFTDSEHRIAKVTHQKMLNDQPFVVFYLGPKFGNTWNGHNRNSLWTFNDWYNTSILMRNHNPELLFVIIGAQYDADYAEEFLQHIGAEGRQHFVNLVGTTEIGVTFSLIKRSKFILSYQSGIGIFSTYLGVPTACFWRPYGNSISQDFFLSVREEMSTAWAPQWAIDSNYLPLIYTKCSPESIVSACINRQWI